MKVDYEPVGAVKVSGRMLGSLALAGVLMAGVAWGGYELIWAAKSNNTDRAAQINRQALGFQQARVDEINRKMADLSSLKNLDKGSTLTEEQAAANKAQEQAITNIICQDWRQVTPTYREGMDTDQVNTLSVMCHTEP